MIKYRKSQFLNRRHRRASLKLVAALNRGAWDPGLSAQAGYHMHNCVERMRRPANR